MTFKPTRATTHPREEMVLLSPQNGLIVAYLLAGRKLSNQIALVNLGIASVTSRVAELRKLGYRIDSVDRRDHFNNRYVEYSMPQAAADA